MFGHQWVNYHFLPPPTTLHTPFTKYTLIAQILDALYQNLHCLKTILLICCFLPIPYTDLNQDASVGFGLNLMEQKLNIWIESVILQLP